MLRLRNMIGKEGFLKRGRNQKRNIYARQMLIYISHLIYV